MLFHTFEHPPAQTHLHRSTTPPTLQPPKDLITPFELRNAKQNAYNIFCLLERLYSAWCAYMTSPLLVGSADLVFVYVCAK